MVPLVLKSPIRIWVIGRPGFHRGWLARGTDAGKYDFLRN